MMLLPSAALEAYLQAIVRDTVVINAKEFRAFIDSNLDASSRCSVLLRLSRDDWRALTRLFVVPSPAARCEPRFAAVQANFPLENRGTSATPSAVR